VRNEKLSNIDKIRSMPKDVLAKYLNAKAKCAFCIQEQESCDCNCTQNTMLWLESEEEV